MLSKLVIVLKKVITGSLKSKPDRRAPMVEYRSITPWMMFTSARLLKDRVYAKSKLAQQMHRWDGLFEIIIQLQRFWPWNPYAIDLISCQTQFASISAQISEAAAICDSKIGRGFVHGQLVFLALLLRTGCNSDYANLFPRLEFTWSSIQTLKIEQADASKVPLRQLRLTSIEFAFHREKSRSKI